MVFGTKAEIDLMKVRGPTWTKMGKHIIHQIIPELAFYAENICSLMRTHFLLVYYCSGPFVSVGWVVRERNTPVLSIVISEKVFPTKINST